MTRKPVAWYKENEKHSILYPNHSCVVVSAVVYSKKHDIVMTKKKNNGNSKKYNIVITTKKNSYSKKHKFDHAIIQLGKIL